MWGNKPDAFGQYSVVSGTGSLAATSGDSRIIEGLRNVSSGHYYSSRLFQLRFVSFFFINFPLFRN